MCTSTISLQWWHTMFLPYPSTPYPISFPYSLQFLNLFTNFFKFTFDAQLNIRLFFFSIFRNLLKFFFLSLSLSLSSFAIPTFPLLSYNSFLFKFSSSPFKHFFIFRCITFNFFVLIISYHYAHRTLLYYIFLYTFWHQPVPFSTLNT
jgi:hypothetical protein